MLLETKLKQTADTKIVDCQEQEVYLKTIINNRLILKNRTLHEKDVHNEKTPRVSTIINGKLKQLTADDLRFLDHGPMDVLPRDEEKSFRVNN